MIFRSARLKEVRKDFLNIIQDKYGQRESDNLFRIIAEEFLGLTSAEVVLSGDNVLSEQEINAVETALNQLQENIPVQYITGSTYFYGAKFKINPGVLIPRPETEELTDWIIKEYTMVTRRDHILDIGTGCGCIAISLQRFFSDAIVSAVDISQEALENADTNARLLDTDIDLMRLDILDRMQWGKSGMFHLIVSNPPYVRESEKKSIKANVRDHEPSQALFVPDEDPLLFYRNILNFSRNHLIRPGWVYFEINENSGEDVVKLLEGSGFSDIDLRQDLNGKDRMIRGRLVK